MMAIAVATLASAARVEADPPGHGPLERFPDPPRLLLPSEVRGNVGYHVGGGNPFPHLAEPRTAEEGTWGWDYQGWWIPRRVISGWWHGRRHQGGTGAYKSDGPKFHP
jgi:hypothetical protein